MFKDEEISEAATGGVLKKGALKHFANFTGKHLCNVIKKMFQHRWFPVKFLKTPILKNIYRRLLLQFQNLSCVNDIFLTQVATKQSYRSNRR